MSKKRWMITAAFAGTSMLALATAHAQGGTTPAGGSVGGVGPSGAPADTTTPPGTTATTPPPATTTPTPVPPAPAPTQTPPFDSTTRSNRTGTKSTGTTGTEGTSGTDPLRTTPSPTDTSGTTGGTSGSNRGGGASGAGGITSSQADETNADVDVDVNVPPARPEPAPPIEVVPPPVAAAPVQPIAADTPQTVPQRTMLDRVGGALLVGGGVEDFTSNSVRSMTGMGGYWNARAIAGTHQVVGVEAAYVGAAHSIDALGLASNAALVSNGVEGALRLNAPILGDRSLVEPFGFVGLGWSHYSLANTNTASSDLNDRDDVMTMPYGGGLDFAYGSFMADARFTYRYTYRNDLMRTSGGRLNNWNVGGQVGFAF